MAKVHPTEPQVSGPCSMSSAGKETFTIWMKSLVCHTNGCTVFDSKGQIVYRVENYDTKGSSEVHLMNLHGHVLFTILKKKLQILGCWNGYRGNFTGRKKEKPSFQVKKYCRILRGDLVCEVRVGFNKYFMVSLGRKKQGFKIVNSGGDIIAEVMQKQLPTGMVLGDDVLTLEIEPSIDQALTVALVLVYGLMSRRL
ncbi:hypothetical protein J1N35_010017 [Gossypium stocksii]|uniref:Tubby C-terminal domain-containing protein n=1 Tax=Gossypium stocksii TaxID=47602 RepID=A0A9D3VZL8_9ROSI|nr:hypothetical protein J1N35_010017 [Gossypium stocksii]